MNRNKKMCATGGDEKLRSKVGKNNFTFSTPFGAHKQKLRNRYYHFHPTKNKINVFQNFFH